MGLRFLPAPSQQQLMIFWQSGQDSNLHTATPVTDPLTIELPD